MEETNDSIHWNDKRNGEHKKSTIHTDLNKLEWVFNTIDCGVLPAVTIAGLLLQSLNAIVLLSKQLRSIAIRFLLAMCLIDVLFLLVQLPFLPVPFIERNGATVSRVATLYNEFVQRVYQHFVLYPISHVCLGTNSWLAVLVSCERLLALLPAKFSSCCAYAARYGVSRRRLSFPAIISAVLLAVIINVICFFDDQKSFGSNSSAVNEILRESSAETHNGPAALIRLVLTYMLPLVLMLLLNAALVYQLVHYHRKRLHSGIALRHREGRGSWNFWTFENRTLPFGRRRQAANAHHSRSTFSTALMVLVTALVHMAFAAPSFGLAVFMLFEGIEAILSNSWLVLTSHVCNVLVLIHCSIDW